jgi:hypothetical protein
MSKKPLSRQQLLDALKAAEVRVVDVPGLGPVRVQAPSWERIMAMRATNPEESSFQWCLAQACVPDLTPEDWASIRANNNGFAMAALFNAIGGAQSPLTDDIVGKPRRG